MRHQWQPQYYLPLLVFAPLFVFLFRDPFHSQVERGNPVIARIAVIGVSGSKYQGTTPGVFVSAMTAGGASGTILVPAARVAGCRIGDVVAAEQKGIRLYLKPAPCGD